MIFTSCLHCAIDTRYWYQLNPMEKTQCLQYYYMSDWRFDFTPEWQPSVKNNKPVLFWDANILPIHNVILFSFAMAQQISPIYFCVPCYSFIADLQFKISSKQLYQVIIFWHFYYFYHNFFTRVKYLLKLLSHKALTPQIPLEVLVQCNSFWCIFTQQPFEGLLLVTFQN